MRYICLFILMICMPAVGGELEPYNGPLIANKDGYQLKVGVRTYDLARLQHFNRYETHMNTLWTDTSVFVGVKLMDVLTDAQIQNFDLLYAEALNDYAITLTNQERGLDTALIVLQKNGALLPLSDKGAFWLMWPALEDRLLKGIDNGTKWIWNLSTIRKVK